MQVVLACPWRSEVRGQLCGTGSVCPLFGSLRPGIELRSPVLSVTPLLSQLVLFGLIEDRWSNLALRDAWALAPTPVASAASPLPCQPCHGQRLLTCKTHHPCRRDPTSQRVLRGFYRDTASHGCPLWPRFIPICPKQLVRSCLLRH